MANELRVALEAGLRGKKVAVYAPDWPGLERGDKNPEAALARLESYRPRYARVAELAGMGPEFQRTGELALVERYEGTGSTDFWGISFAFSRVDQAAMSGAELDRELRLLQSCWNFFDLVRGRVSSEMRKGPRGGGRDRDRIVTHTLGAEQDWAPKLGLRRASQEVVTDAGGLAAYRQRYCDAIRSLHAEGKMARTWPLRYLIRHSAYHLLDHAWEMEDKDLTAN